MNLEMNLVLIHEDKRLVPESTMLTANTRNKNLDSSEDVIIALPCSSKTAGSVLYFLEFMAAPPSGGIIAHLGLHIHILPRAQLHRKPCSTSPESVLNLPGGDAQSRTEYSISRLTLGHYITDGSVVVHCVYRVAEPSLCVVSRLMKVFVCFFEYMEFLRV